MNELSDSEEEWIPTPRPSVTYHIAGSASSRSYATAEMLGQLVLNRLGPGVCVEFHMIHAANWIDYIDQLGDTYGFPVPGEAIIWQNDRGPLIGLYTDFAHHIQRYYGIGWEFSEETLDNAVQENMKQAEIIRYGKRHCATMERLEDRRRGLVQGGKVIGQYLAVVQAQLTQFKSLKEFVEEHSQLTLDIPFEEEEEKDGTDPSSCSPATSGVPESVQSKVVDVFNSLPSFPTMNEGEEVISLLREMEGEHSAQWQALCQLLKNKEETFIHFFEDMASLGRTVLQNHTVLKNLAERNAQDLEDVECTLNVARSYGEDASSARGEDEISEPQPVFMETTEIQPKSASNMFTLDRTPKETIAPSTFASALQTALNVQPPTEKESDNVEETTEDGQAVDKRRQRVVERVGISVPFRGKPHKSTLAA